MRTVADTGPLLSALNRRDEAHRLAASIVTELGRDLLVPVPVLTEVDHMVRDRVGSAAARTFLAAVLAGEHTVVHPSNRVLRRAAAIDSRYASLDLGLVDSTVMALAEPDDLPILTFDFADFRAAAPERGWWNLVVDEARYRAAVGR